MTEENGKSVEIGSLKDHIETAKKGIQEFKIWNTLTYALVCMAKPNINHRIDLRDKETIKKISDALGMEVDYKSIEEAIIQEPFLVKSNEFRDPIDKTKDDSGKSLTKKQLKINSKKEKIQLKIIKLNDKLSKIKNKKCDRAMKVQKLIEELEIKADRVK